MLQKLDDMSPNRAKAYIYFLITVVIWGLATVVIKLTLDGIDPLPFLIYRFGISTLIAVVYFIYAKSFKFRNSKDLVLFIFYAILGTSIALGLLFFGLDQTTVLNLSLITLSGPLVAQAAGKIFLRERLTKREQIGTAIAFGGTLLTVVEPILASINGIGSLTGNLLVIAYMISDIASIILMKKLLRKGYSPSALTHGSFVIGFFTLLPIILLIMPTNQIISQISTLPFKYHLGVWYMAILSGTLAYWIRAKGQKTIEVGEGALFGYLTPVLSSILAVMFLGDKMTLVYGIGAIIILFGVALAETKPKRV